MQRNLAAEAGDHVRGRGGNIVEAVEGREVDGDEAEAAFEVGPEDCFGVYDFWFISDVLDEYKLVENWEDLRWKSSWAMPSGPSKGLWVSL